MIHAFLFVESLISGFLTINILIPMHHRLSEPAVQEFRRIIWNEFHIELTYDQAEQRAVEVLDFFWFLFDHPEERLAPMPPTTHPPVSSGSQGQLF